MDWELADLDEARLNLPEEIFDVVLWAIEGKDYSLKKRADVYALSCPCGRAEFIRVDGFPSNVSWDSNVGWKADRLRRSVNRCPDHADL